MKLSEQIREPATRIGGTIRSCTVEWFLEKADEAAQLEAENEALRKAYKKIQDADGPDVTMPIDMTLAMGEMTDLINRSKP